jgi:uncharacterized protein (DUF952 family)
MAIIFHIARKEEWGNSSALYRPEMFSIDGFVHCSTREQVVKVANTRFRGQPGLVLLCIDTGKITSEIRYENLEGGRELFPHIYGEINAKAVVQVVDFEPGLDGYFALPAKLAA